MLIMHGVHVGRGHISTGGRGSHPRHHRLSRIIRRISVNVPTRLGRRSLLRSRVLFVGRWGRDRGGRSHMW